MASGYASRRIAQIRAEEQIVKPIPPPVAAPATEEKPRRKKPRRAKYEPSVLGQENRELRRRQQQRDIARAQRRQSEREKSAQLAEEIRNSHLYDTCSIPKEELREMATRIRGAKHASRSKPWGL